MVKLMFHTIHTVPHEKTDMWNKQKYWYDCVKDHHIYICSTVPHIYIVYREVSENYFTKKNNNRLYSNVLPKTVERWNRICKRSNTNSFTVSHYGERLVAWRNKCS